MTSKSKNYRSPSSSIDYYPDQTTDNFSLPITRTNNYGSSPSVDGMRKMTCSSPMRQQDTSLTVLDVYDEAALIGKDFERIIETYGTDIVRDLVPKVIRILELLESQAAKNEKTTDEFLEMNTRIERLEAEKNEARELREKYDRDVELIEDQWRKETENLMAVVSKLEDENRRLRDQHARNSDLHNKHHLPIQNETVSITREELQCIKTLTEENIKFKRLLKSKEKELTQKTFDMEAVQAQLERVCKLNCTLRQKNTFSTNQTQRLMRDKLDLEVQLKEKENYINHVKDRVGDDLISPTSSTDPIDDVTASEANRPRFTLDELRQVLWERNDLKTKLMEVEEELRLFKEQEDEGNGAVEGPIPLEPEEKQDGYKRDESKIRQFAKICLFFPTIACFAVASFCLRSFFPSSRRTSTSEHRTSNGSLTMPITPRSATVTADKSDLTLSSSSIQSNGSTLNQVSTENQFRNNRKASKTNIPLLSPPLSE